MFARIHQIISPPFFEGDEVKTRAAEQLNTITLVILVSVTLYVIAYPIFAPQLIARLFLALPLFPFLIVILMLIRYGRVRLASALLVTGLWILLIFYAAVSGGVRATGFSGLIIVVLSAGILLGRRAAFGFVVLSMLMGLLMVYGEAQGALPPSSILPSAPVVWSAQAVYFIAAAALLHLALQNINESLTRARQELDGHTRAEQALRETEERFRSLTEATFEGIMIHDRGVILDANQALADLLGFRHPEDLIGKNGLATPPLTPESLEPVKKNIQLGSTKPFDIAVMKQDGSICSVETQGREIAYKGRNVRVVALRDITERKRAEEALTDERNLLRTLIDHIPDYIYVKDAASRFLIANTSVARHMGAASPDALVGKTDWDFYPSERAAQFYADEQAILQSGEPLIDHDEPNVDAAGRLRWIMTTKLPMRDSGGQIVGLAGIGHDLTERKQAEEQIRRQAEEMTALYEITHDLVIERNVSKLLHTIVERAVRLVKASGGGLYLCEPEQRQVRCVVSYNTLRDYTGVVLKYGEGAAGRVAESGKPLLVDDYRIWAGRAIVYEQDQPFASLLTVPMHWQDRVIGVIHVLEQTTPRAFTQEHLRVVTLFADQAAIAIENSRLLESKQHQITELTILHAAGLAAAQGRDEDEVIAEVTKIVSRVYAHRCGVFLIDEDGNTMRPHPSYHGFSFSPLVLPLSYGIAGKVASTGLPIMANDVSAEPAYFRDDETTRSELCVPIRLINRIIGVFNVESQELNAFDQEDQSFLTTIAGGLATAIERLRYLKSELLRRQEAAAIAEVGRDISASLQLDVVLERIASHAKDLLRAETSAVYLSEPAESILRATVAIGPDAEEIKLDPHKMGEGILGYIAAQKAGEIINDTRTDPRAILVKGTELTPLEHLMGVPILSKNQLAGLIAVWRYGEGQEFHSADLDFLGALAGQAAVAIENARLFDEARRRAAEFATLYETARELADKQHLPSLLQVIVNRAATLFAAPSAAIYLHDPIRHDLELACSLGPQLPVGARMAWGEGLAGRAAQTRQPFIVDDYHTWPDRSPQFEAIPFSGDLQVPMLYHGELIGVLGVSDVGPTSRRFTDADARLLSLFAAQAASTVHDARLLETLEQRVAERTRELAEANERLTELDQLKSHFVSDVSHELRTPVANLNLYLNLLERGKLEKRAEYMTILRQQAARLTQLIEDILDLSRLEAGAAQAVFESLDLNSLAAQVVAALRPSAEAKGLRFQFEPGENLPTIRGAANQLTQVITNLVSNAINYTRAGAIIVSMRAEQDRVLLQVQDTGIGIDEEDRPHLFERFYRGRRTAQSTTSGTGLGLTIVNEIIEAHGGQVEVESQPEQGSTFTVSLPIMPDEESMSN